MIYEEMRLKELDAAYAEVMEDIKNGDYITSLDEHFKEIDDVIKSR